MLLFQVPTEFPLGELDSVEYYTLFHFIVRFVGRDSHVTEGRRRVI